MLLMLPHSMFRNAIEMINCATKPGETKCVVLTKRIHLYQRGGRKKALVQGSEWVTLCVDLIVLLGCILGIQMRTRGVFWSRKCSVYVSNDRHCGDTQQGRLWFLCLKERTKSWFDLLEWDFLHYLLRCTYLAIKHIFQRCFQNSFCLFFKTISNKKNLITQRIFFWKISDYVVCTWPPLNTFLTTCYHQWNRLWRTTWIRSAVKWTLICIVIASSLANR